MRHLPNSRLCNDEKFAVVPHTAHLQNVFDHPRQPAVLRGIGAMWPAVQRWNFDYLASLSPDLPVQLVVGNREAGATRFLGSTFGEYLSKLENVSAAESELLYLKEFDLLKTFPQLHQDVCINEIFPRRSLKLCNTWIGPARARTGLHYDLINNITMLITGSKRFYLASPGSVESLHQVSDKYDRWAKISRIDIHELVSQCAAQKTGQFYSIDLMPGDALYVPAGWWHEVVNLDASILLSGFFGSQLSVGAKWLRTSVLQALHHAGFWRGHCTCHGI